MNRDMNMDIDSPIFVTSGALFYPEHLFLDSDDIEFQGYEHELHSDEYVHDPLIKGVATEVIVADSYGHNRHNKQRVFVIPKMWLELKEKLVKDMKEFFDSNQPCVPRQLISGCSYAVFFKGIWNRVCMLHLTDAGKAKLIFYDEGFIRKMYVDRIKYIPLQFLSVDSLVVQANCLQYCPAVWKGDSVTFEFRYMLKPRSWSVQFVAGPVKMVNSIVMLVEQWVMQADSMFPLTPRSTISDMVTLFMALEGFNLPSPGVLIPVKILLESSKHIIVTPVAWLNELRNLISGLPAITATCRRLPYELAVPGVSCAVPYEGGWFRARIRSVDRGANSMAFKVRLTDLGIITYVDQYEARILPRQLLPYRKRPLCFAIKKSEEIMKDLPIGEFRCITLDHKAEDNSWIVQHRPDLAAKKACSDMQV